MGTISKGILGGFSGKVGTVIGGSWKGIQYMRSISARRKKGSTQKQHEQQLKFGLITKFQQPLNSLLMLSFKGYAIRMTGANSALSYNIRNAITGLYPDYAIDYSKVLVSRGDLPNALNPTATLGDGNRVDFAWTNNSGAGKASNRDKAMLVIYCPDLQQCVYTTGSAERLEEEDSLIVSGFSGHTVETWIGFFSADGRDTATSIYTGKLVIS